MVFNVEVPGPGSYDSNQEKTQHGLPKWTYSLLNSDSKKDYNREAASKTPPSPQDQATTNSIRDS